MDAVTMRQKAIGKYLETGLVLVKLRPNSKVPMERDWAKLPYRKKFNTKGNFGIVLQHDQLIIDVDPRNFKHKIDSFVELKKTVKLPKTFVVRTGAGGFHYYYKKPASLVIKKAIIEYPGVEFKTKGSQIVGAGSIHPDTNEMYRPFASTKLSDVVDAPADLLALVAETYQKSGAPRHRQAKYTEDEASITRYLHYLQTVDGAVQGNKGDEYTYVVAAYGKDIGLAPDTVYSMMVETWNTKCDPPWGLRELKQKVKNAYLYGTNEAGCDSFKNIFGTDADNSNVPVVATNKDGLIINNLVNACYFLGSKQIAYIAAGEKKMKPIPNPLGKIIRYNVLRNRIEFDRPAPWHNAKAGDDITNVIWETTEVSDAEVINIKYYLDHLTGLSWGRAHIQDAVIKTAHDNKFNPVLDWLENLEWDKVERLDTWLHDYCGVINSEYSRTVGSKTLIAAVARSYRPGIKFDHMLILEGAQGIGKSTAVGILGGKWCIDIMLRTDNKDTVQLINGAWIIEVSEMAGLRRAEVESLKAFLSRPTDSIRPPFGKTPIDFPRRSIFIGTINPSSMGYLNDETGNRRYWPVLCKKIHMSALKRDRDVLFAEALIRFKQGEKLYISDGTIEKEAIRQQETRSIVHPWHQVIYDHFERYDIKKISVKNLYLDAINGDISRFRYTDKSLILTILHRMGWKRNKSNEYVNPDITKDVDNIIEGM